MKCADCKHWFDNGTDYSSCDRDALMRERDFFCAAWESKNKINWKPDTNADRIRQRSDEELAEWLDINNFVMSKSPKCNGCFSGKCDLKDCRQCYLDWLKTPVEEGEG